MNLEEDRLPSLAEVVCCAPVGLAGKIERRMRDFLWKGYCKDNATHLISLYSGKCTLGRIRGVKKGESVKALSLSWEQVCRPKKFRGFGNWIKDDDKMIQAEGIESLSEKELILACRERGILRSCSVEEMREELHDWLDLYLIRSLSSSLLILSRAFLVHGKVKPEVALQATLSSLPDEVVDNVGVTALPSEDPVAECRRKLEFLEMQEELIKEEEEKEEKEQAKLKQSFSKKLDVALER
ncbi:hypothetical protein L484_022266 [Morus notabilis]|uniref:Letm1 RBD domain-containing protein n=1 Tax=Morus notabilis TaxID=981085 RepID=W9SE50_9ROSA|nr:hypothetical protein L484_022266 [Morus notabilis]